MKTRSKNAKLKYANTFKYANMMVHYKKLFALFIALMISTTMLMTVMGEDSIPASIKTAIETTTGLSMGTTCNNLGVCSYPTGISLKKQGDGYSLTNKLNDNVPGWTQLFDATGKPTSIKYDSTYQVKTKNDIDPVTVQMIKSNNEFNRIKLAWNEGNKLKTFVSNKDGSITLGIDNSAQITVNKDSVQTTYNGVSEIINIKSNNAKEVITQKNNEILTENYELNNNNKYERTSFIKTDDLNNIIEQEKGTNSAENGYYYYKKTPDEIFSTTTKDDVSEIKTITKNGDGYTITEIEKLGINNDKSMYKIPEEKDTTIVNSNGVTIFSEHGEYGKPEYSFYKKEVDSTTKITTTTTEDNFYIDGSGNLIKEGKIIKTDATGKIIYYENNYPTDNNYYKYSEDPNTKQVSLTVGGKTIDLGESVKDPTNSNNNVLKLPVSGTDVYHDEKTGEIFKSESRPWYSAWLLSPSKVSVGKISNYDDNVAMQLSDSQGTPLKIGTGNDAKTVSIDRFKNIVINNEVIYDPKEIDTISESLQRALNFKTHEELTAYINTISGLLTHIPNTAQQKSINIAKNAPIPAPSKPVAPVAPATPPAVTPPTSPPATPLQAKLTNLKSSLTPETLKTSLEVLKDFINLEDINFDKSMYNTENTENNIVIKSNLNPNIKIVIDNAGNLVEMNYVRKDGTIIWSQKQLTTEDIAYMRTAKIDTTKTSEKTFASLYQSSPASIDEVYPFQRDIIIGLAAKSGLSKSDLNNAKFSAGTNNIVFTSKDKFTFTVKDATAEFSSTKTEDGKNINEVKEYRIDNGLVVHQKSSINNAITYERTIADNGDVTVKLNGKPSIVIGKIEDQTKFSKILGSGKLDPKGNTIILVGANNKKIFVKDSAGKDKVCRIDATGNLCVIVDERTGETRFLTSDEKKQVNNELMAQESGDTDADKETAANERLNAVSEFALLTFPTKSLWQSIGAGIFTNPTDWVKIAFGSRGDYEDLGETLGSLFIGDAQIKKNRLRVEQQFCERMGYGDVSCWSSKICENQVRKEVDGTTVALSIEGSSKTGMATAKLVRQDNGTESDLSYIYVVTYTVENPFDDKNLSINIKLKDENGNLQDYFVGGKKTILPSAVASQSANVNAVFASRRKYTSIYLSFNPAIKTLAGSTIAEVFEPAIEAGKEQFVGTFQPRSSTTTTGTENNEGKRDDAGLSG